jgi:hypothetical protein
VKSRGSSSGAGYERGLPLHGQIDEVGDHIAVLARDLPRAISFEKPALNSGEIVMVNEKVAIEFAYHLGDLIRGTQVR